MTAVSRVYLDANILKFSAIAVLRLFPREQIINWDNGEVSEHNYYEPKYVNRNERITNSELRREVALIPIIAEYVRAKRLVAMMDLETRFETWGLPNMDSVTGKFFGAPIGTAPPPVPRDRMIFCTGRDPDNMQRRYLRGIKHPRFLELQRLTGGYQGTEKYAWNQVLDAFALWCAESNKCDYFLTLDLKLIKVGRSRGAMTLATKILRPSELLAELYPAVESHSE